LANSLGLDSFGNDQKIGASKKAMITKILLGVLIGGAIGAVAGYFGKCSSGTCPLAANPHRGAIYGAIMGTLLALALSIQPKEKPEGSDVGRIENKYDSNVREFKADGSLLMESLTKETFLQKVFNYEQNKEWKFEGELPCIIDFYADWCGPCKMVEPILHELAQEYQGKLNIYRVDTQAQQELAAAFAIQSIPSLLFVPLNDKPQIAVGALPKETLKKAIEEVLKVE
jgi:thioredoxin 1